MHPDRWKDVAAFVAVVLGVISVVRALALGTIFRRHALCPWLSDSLFASPFRQKEADTDAQKSI